MGGPLLEPRLQIDVAAGRVDVLHRLALAVAPRDAVTGAPIAAGLRAGIETARSRPRRALRRGVAAPLDPARRFPAEPLRPGSAFVLRHTTVIARLVPRPGEIVVRVIVRVDDPDRRWIPRRFDVPLWSTDELEAPDVASPASGPLPAESRLLRPWLLPGPGYAPPGGATGVRLQVTRAGNPVRWARVDAFGDGGLRVGWGHGDEHGDVLLLVTDTGALPPPAPSRLDVVLRVHTPAEAVDPDPLDPLADLPVETVARSAVPPTAQDLDNDLLRGITPPTGYVAAPDDVVPLTVGRVVPLASAVP